ncbi:MAG TPA: protein translocase subunit SecD [Candidatus Limnocylindrales bacterium]|nr:protein translocase subunit SecD [Candidatus Limnocylindrales bacterium]
MKLAVQPGRLLILIVLCLMIIASSIWAFHRASDRNTGIRRGLDIAGGLYVLLEAVQTGDQEIDDDAIERAITIIRMRVDEIGVAEPIIAAQGDNRIRIELPDLEDIEQARDIIGRTALLKFVGPDGLEIVTGANLVLARAERNPGTSPHPFVSIEFDAEGARLFAAATEKYLQQPIAIVLDDEVISEPIVRATITDGRAVIEGDFSFDEAANLALLLRSGALPVELRELESRMIGPTLGRRTEEIAVYAAGIGLLAVLLYMIIFYRLAGIIAGIALVFYLTMVMVALTFLPTTLTLPGIAGIILSVGMAVDANVIIFERIKEELRAGRSVRSATESGFQRAFRAILDSNVTTLIATIVLFSLASGPIRGFAVTLSVGILCSMFTAIVLTRFLLRQAYKAGILSGGAYLGVKV